MKGIGLETGKQKGNERGIRRIVGERGREMRRER